MIDLLKLKEQCFRNAHLSSMEKPIGCDFYRVIATIHIRITNFKPDKKNIKTTRTLNLFGNSILSDEYKEDGEVICLEQHEAITAIFNQLREWIAKTNNKNYLTYPYDKRRHLKFSKHEFFFVGPLTKTGYPLEKIETGGL